TNWRSAHAVACAAGWRSKVSIAFSVITPGLPVVAGAVDGPANVPELFRGRALRRERLHHELARRSAERAIEQVAHQLPLRGLLAQPRAIDVRAVALVAVDQALLRHDLQQLQRGRVRRGALLGQRLVHLSDGAGPALPEDAQDRQLGVGRTGNV